MGYDRCPYLSFFDRRKNLVWRKIWFWFGRRDLNIKYTIFDHWGIHRFTGEDITDYQSNIEETWHYLFIEDNEKEYHCLSRWYEKTGNIIWLSKTMRPKITGYRGNMQIWTWPGYQGEGKKRGIICLSKIMGYILPVI
jgi:hypothetical protein